MMIASVPRLGVYYSLSIGLPLVKPAVHAFTLSLVSPMTNVNHPPIGVGRLRGGSIKTVVVYALSQ